MTYPVLARRSIARRVAATLLSAVVIVAPALTGRTVSRAAGESVAIWFTTTDDAAGRHVIRGLQQQTDGSLRALGKCMDVVSGGTANGTKVQLFDCNGTGAQRWTATAAHGVVNPASGRCLDASGPSSANGTRLQIWDCTGGTNQKWTLPTQ